VFKAHEFTKDFAMGVTDVHVAEVESVEEIRENIKRPGGRPAGATHRLAGLRRETAPREVAYGKMKNMVQAAREVEEELDAGEIDVVAGPEASAD